MQQQNFATPYYNQYYPPQVAYDGAGPNNNFTSYPQPYQWPQPSAAARQTPFGYYPPLPQPANQPYTLDKPGKPFQPFKSALKRRETVPAPQQNQAQQIQQAQQPMRRNRTTSNPQKAEDLQRNRSLSGNAKRDNEYPTACSRMFVSFIGTDEIHIEHLSKKAMEEIRTTIFTIWPHGMILDELKDLNWKVKFTNAPWCMGPSAQEAWKMLLALFTLFSRRGYSFQTSISIGTTSPRLIFLATDIDDNSQFFFAHPSNGGRKITFINPPAKIKHSIGRLLQQTSSGNHVEIDYGPEEIQNQTTTFSIELKKGMWTALTPGHLLANILHVLDTQLDTQLETAIPLARKGPLSKLPFGGARPEILLFKVLNK